jgi:hypothetical protein
MSTAKRPARPTAETRPQPSAEAAQPAVDYAAEAERLKQAVEFLNNELLGTQQTLVQVKFDLHLVRTAHDKLQTENTKLVAKSMSEPAADQTIQ